ncbi:unnamed protein product [Chrysoparadoxa australica]
MELVSEPLSINVGHISVAVIAARGLPDKLGKRNGCNSFCQIRIGDEVCRSTTVARSQAPKWRREQYFLPVQVPSSCLFLDRPSMSGKVTQTKDTMKAQLHPAGLSQQLSLMVELLHEETASGDKEAGHVGYDKLSATVKGSAPSAVSLGTAAVPLHDLLVGRLDHFDDWVDLENGCQVRLSLDYDMSGPPIRAGDWVRLLNIGDPLDLAPLSVESDLMVDAVNDDHAILSYVTKEKWRCQVEVNRALIYLSQPQTTLGDLAESISQEITDISERLADGPAATVLVKKFEDVRSRGLEALQQAGEEALDGSKYLWGRWWTGGVDQLKNDLVWAIGLEEGPEPAQVQPQTAAASLLSSASASAEEAGLVLLLYHYPLQGSAMLPSSLLVLTCLPLPLLQMYQHQSQELHVPSQGALCVTQWLPLMAILMSGLQLRGGSLITIQVPSQALSWKRRYE